MSLALRYRGVPGEPHLRYRGPDGRTITVARLVQGAAIAAIIGPQGSIAGGATPTKFTISSPAGTWVIPHGLGRIPIVQVFLGSGEQVMADVTVDAIYVTVVFAAPQTGYILAF